MPDQEWPGFFFFQHSFFCFRPNRAHAPGRALPACSRGGSPWKASSEGECVGARGADRRTAPTIDTRRKPHDALPLSPPPTEPSCSLAATTRPHPRRRRRRRQRRHPPPTARTVRAYRQPLSATACSSKPAGRKARGWARRIRAWWSRWPRRRRRGPRASGPRNACERRKAKQTCRRRRHPRRQQSPPPRAPPGRPRTPTVLNGPPSRARWLESLMTGRQRSQRRPIHC